MQEILSGSGFHVLSSLDYEADDLAGTLAELNKGSCRIRLYTKDRDYLQLVDDAYDVRCLMHTDAEKTADFRRRYGGIVGADEIELPPFYKTTIEHTESTVFGELGVYPRNVVDLKAIEGDASDNIPGVKGVSSAATPLINEYGSLEAIYQAIESSKTTKEDKELNAFWKESLGIKRSPLKALREHKDEAFLSKTLASIKRDIPIESGAEESMVQNINRDSFNSRMEWLDIKSVRFPAC